MTDTKYVFFGASYIPCELCGVPLHPESSIEHVCDPQKKVEYTIFKMSKGIASLEHDIELWLCSNEGKFFVWEAVRYLRRYYRHENS